LSSADLNIPEDRDRVREAFDDLYAHIAREEDGLFPASLTTLDGADWDAAINAWHRAHPGQEMIAEPHHQNSVG
jgi:hypothetical protein